MTAGFFFLEDTLTPLIGAVDLVGSTEAALEDYAPEVESYAKENAPWNDITGDARQGLTADVSRQGDVVYLELYHTVDYGLWLEVIENGKWATIMPTLEHFSREIFAAVGAVETGEVAGDD